MDIQQVLLIYGEKLTLSSFDVNIEIKANDLKFINIILQIILYYYVYKRSTIDNSCHHLITFEGS
ncbi:MAG: hypothetical protein QXI71_04380 [Candidatus Bathyarchaeia archaeon]